MQRRDLQLTLGLLDLQSDDSFCLLSDGTSPLSLISPNAVLAGSASRASKKASGAAGLTAADSLGGAGDELENEPLGELPQFGARRGGSRRPDSRRQSLAIGAMFAGLSTGTGLLGDAELSVGDEEVQVPLARSAKLLGGAANHSSLFVDPDNGELLDAELPSPLMDAGSTPAGSFAADGAAPWFASPVPSPTLTASPKTRRNSAARAVVVAPELDDAWQGLGLDDYDIGDFKMQEPQKVKELALLFKRGASSADSGGSKPSSPAEAGQVPRAFASGAVGHATSAPAPQQHEQEQLQLEQTGLQAQHSTQAPNQQHRPTQPQQKSEGQRSELSSAPKLRTGIPTPSRQAATAAAPSPARPPTNTAQPGSAPRPAVPRPTSRLPTAPGAASRLRPPTTSNGFFSKAATDTRQARSGAAAPQSGKPAARPTSAGSRRAGAPAASTAAAGAAAQQPPGTGSAQPSNSRSRSPAISRLRLPGSGAPAAAAGGPKAAKPPQQSAASRAAPSCGQGRATGIPTPSPSITPRSDGSADLSPNSARLRFLEQNPHLAFGGGAKLADSPVQPDEPPRKLTAAERHLIDWQDHL